MLKIIFLNGGLQGSEFDLSEGLSIGSDKKCSVQVPEAPGVFEFKCDSSGGFQLSSKSKRPLIDLGGEALSKIEVLPGIIFSIGGIGVSVQEGEAKLNKDSRDVSLKEIFNDNNIKTSVLFPMKKPMSLDFVRGPLLNTSIDIHWHPFSIGTKSNIHHCIDEHIKIKEDLLEFQRPVEDNEQTTLLKPLISNFISINKKLISKPTIVKTGDLVEFSETAFYIKIR